MLFTAGFFALLLVYVEEDAAEARKLCYGILGANLAMSCLSYLFDGEGAINLFELPKDFFVQNIRIMVVGTAALIVDVILVIYTYEWLSRRLPESVFLRAGLTLVFVLSIDTFIFVTGSFLGSPQYGSLLLSGILGKSAIALFYAAILDLFLRWTRRRKSIRDEASPTPRAELEDVFHFLTFRQKYEMMKELHAELEESQTQQREINERSRRTRPAEDLRARNGTRRSHRETGVGERIPRAAARTRGEAEEEDERVQISREIHDELGQLLTGLKMDVRWLENRLSSPGLPPTLNPLLDRAVEASELVDQSIATVQDLAVKLRPSALDQLGLADAVTNYAQKFEQRFGIPVTVTLGDPDLEIMGQVGNELFFICQEALTNVARHAKATSVGVDIEQSGHEVVLEVCDDGIGFDLSLLHSPKSLGLIGIEERALQIGGVVKIEPRRSGGTRVNVRAPLPKSHR